MADPGFAERMGLKQPKTMQIADVDRDLRVALWNALTYYLQDLDSNYAAVNSGFFAALQLHLWERFFKQAIDSMPPTARDYGDRSPGFWDIIRKWYTSPDRQWHEFYEFIEAVGSLRYNDATHAYFVKRVNEALEAETSGYRYVSGKLAPVTNSEELRAIQDAATPPGTALRPVSIHIQQAIDHLSDKTNPDYRNSMKESILAVEAVCKIIAQNEKATLDQALNALATQATFHPAVQKAFKALYGYTNDADGIRHALKDINQSEQEDARFMLVACSAFVNLITEKARKQNSNRSPHLSIRVYISRVKRSDKWHRETKDQYLITTL